MVKIRLWRTGATKKPSYRVVVTESRMGPSGKFIEVIGYYSPLTTPPTIKIDGDKVKAWVSKGAKMSDTVAHLMDVSAKSAQPAQDAAATPAPATT